MERNRIGVFGGSFDPIHIGHLVAAAGARHACGLHNVLLVVANEPWQKVDVRVVASAEARYRAVAAAVAGHSGLEASRLEIDRGGVSYSVDTLRELNRLHPDSDLYLIVGADTASRLGTWHNWPEVAELAHLVVVNRPGGEPAVPAAPWRVTQVVIPAIDISSTDLRRRFVDGRPLDFLIPVPALVSLEADGLYPGLQKS